MAFKVVTQLNKLNKKNKFILLAIVGGPLTLLRFKKIKKKKILLNSSEFVLIFSAAPATQAPVRPAEADASESWTESCGV